MTALPHWVNHPPVWLALFAAAVWGTARLWAPWGDAARWPGLALITLGCVAIGWAGLTLLASGTTVMPHARPSALVAGGPFRLSRNPIYLAQIVVLGGMALVLGAPLALVLLVPFQQVLEQLFVLPEEAILERDLGQPYLDYKARVRRWI